VVGERKEAGRAAEGSEGCGTGMLALGSGDEKEEGRFVGVNFVGVGRAWSREAA
jgi:hypothetical protein